MSFFSLSVFSLIESNLERNLIQKKLYRCVIGIFFYFVISITNGATVIDKPLSTVDAIRMEATLPNDNELGYPLPLVGHWNTGRFKKGFSPAYQMNLIEKGHFLLPWFEIPLPNSYIDPSYYEAALKKAAELKLPISFLSTQWERLFTDDVTYKSLPDNKNPSVITVDGKLTNKASPFGPLEPWESVGQKWTSTNIVKKMQELYPDPPLILFVSNNEQPKLNWTEVESSKQYLALYGKNRDDNFKRQVVGDGYIKRYRTLQEGMREGLIKSSWKKAAKFVGYNAFAGLSVGRWPGWINYSLYVPGRLEPWPLAWDGVSASYYVNDWDASTDYTLRSPLIGAMNWVYEKNQAIKLNPEFWLEISAWDGHQINKVSDKRKQYELLGQSYNPHRYVGMVKFGMWLLRPRLIREFRYHLEDLEKMEPYFLELVNAVDDVHTNLTLRKFWRKGNLVANRASSHPFDAALPKEYKNAERWFLLDASVNPKRPWKQDTEIHAFSLALVLGTTPQREWLIYTYSPVSDRKKVKVILPDYGELTLDFLQEGQYYYVTEKTKRVVPLLKSPPIAPENPKLTIGR